MKRILLMMSLVLAALSFAPQEAVAQRKSDEPLIVFEHRYNPDWHMKMRLSKLKTYNWLLPGSLRREIGDDYYPAIRRDLVTADKTKYKEGEAEVERYPDGKVKLKLIFPNFVMTISNVTWEQLDVVFSEYF